MLECLPLVLNGLLWYFQNMQVTQGGRFLIILRFMGIILLLDSLMSYLKEQWFRMWCQTRISLPSLPIRSLVEHSLDMSVPVRSYHIASFSASSKLVGILDGLLVGFRRYSPASRLLSWPKIRIFQVTPQGASLVRSSRVANLVGSEPFWYLNMSFGDICPMESSLMVVEGSDRATESGSEVGPLVVF